MSVTRPTKKQRELLGYIEGFIVSHGYGPSYREIMRALGYKSVSTVATHIDNLITRGHLRKRDNSARSLEILRTTIGQAPEPRAASTDQEQWLVNIIERRFKEVERAQPGKSDKRLDDLYVLVGALHVLGMEAASTYKARLATLISA